LGALHFATANWEEVEPAAAYALEGSPPVRCTALTLVGRARLRRGAPGALATLREAWELAVSLHDCQWVAPAAAALAEAAVLAGNPRSALAELTEAYQLARRYGEPSVRAELMYWMGRAGEPVGGGGLSHPYALLADGRWHAAAETWRVAGCRYEHAAALAESADPSDQLAALTALTELKAEPIARLIRARLRAQGVARIPRGRALSSRTNRAGLTRRQVEVLRLLADGLTNSEIADKLILSVRTVDSHVTEVLHKLGSQTRRQAVARAAEFGISTSDDGPGAS
jgi:DNA-binding CsgD family transcriptional regulator